MTLKEFFKTFDLFADTPNAVEKMRELVFGLAIQGRLVSTDLRDENVENLLFANDQKRRIIAKTDRRADVANLSLLSAEDRWEIKETWSWRALADLVLFLDYRGKTPTKLSHGVRLLTARNVKQGEVNLSPEEFLSEHDYQSWMTRGFPKAGDVLFTTEAPMGNAAVVRLKERFALAQRVICFQSYGAIDPSFLVLQILSAPFQFFLDKNGTGVTAKGIKASKLKRLPVAVPPLSEQKRIVAKVDELMTLCDQLEAQQQERETKHAALTRAAVARFSAVPTPANLNLLFHKSYTIPPADLRKTILTLAVRGKLVSQNPQDLPATVAFPKLAISKISAGIREVPAGWFKIPLGKVGTWRGGGTPSKARPDFWKGDVPWVSPKDMKVFRISDAEDHISKSAVENSSVVIIPKGSLLMVVRGMILARAFPVAIAAREVTINQDMKAVVPFYPEILEFLLLALRALECEALSLIARSTHGTCKFETQHLHSLAIAIPPLAEQRRIVAKVDELMALVDALEKQLTASRTKAAQLMDAVVAELTTA